MLFRFSLYGFLKNQRYFEPFFMLALLSQGLSFFMIGVLYAFRSLVINLLEIPSGALADGYGRRVTMIVSLVSYICSFAVFGLAPNTAFLFLAMLLYGVGDAFRTGTHKSMIFEWLKLRGEEEDRTRVYGATRSWSKFGSALSAILAAILVVVTDDYQIVFLLATIPYICNLVNLIGYPAELDGLVYRESLYGAVASIGERMRSSIKYAWRKPQLKNLLGESMAWEGVFAAIKDYLQPAMMLMLTASIIGVAAAESPDAAEVKTTGISSAAAISVGVVYTLLFLASGFASRYADSIVKWQGSTRLASKFLWTVNLGLFGALLLFDLVGVQFLVVAVFVFLAILQNFWRPILIGRIDKQTQSGRGATILSLESQAQRLTTLVVGPIAGLLVDFARRDGVPGNFWPLALIGGIAAGTVFYLQYIRRSDEPIEPNEEPESAKREGKTKSSRRKTKPGRSSSDDAQESIT
ncbi:MAG: hypothetical protein Aurels2KO_38610 [Aureliella sp.]